MIKMTKKNLPNEVRYCLSCGKDEIHLSLYQQTNRSSFAKDLLAARDMMRSGFRFKGI